MEMFYWQATGNRSKQTPLAANIKVLSHDHRPYTDGYLSTLNPYFLNFQNHIYLPLLECFFTLCLTVLFSKDKTTKLIR